MSANLFPATIGQGALFADGYCECDRCLNDAMLQREPSEILYRARVHLGAGREDALSGQVAIFEALTLLRFLETKCEVTA